jgi:hypothetical protein
MKIATFAWLKTTVWLKLLAGTLAGVVAAGGIASAQAPKSAQKWDQVANIKEMATHIGNVQRNQGADKAMSFIDACYRTHSLGSVYSKSFEGCIVADFLLAQALVAVINRVPAEELRKTGMAAPEDIMKAMQKRVSSAFDQYSISSADAQAFIALTERQGLPAFLLTVFPKAGVKSQD